MTSAQLAVHTADTSEVAVPFLCANCCLQRRRLSLLLHFAARATDNRQSLLIKLLVRLPLLFRPLLPLLV
jgi:hypothetical protein